MRKSTDAKPAGGPRRLRTTSRSVRIIDRVTTIGITVGGLFVIVAVLGILAYLIVVVVPLFRGADAKKQAAYRLLPANVAANVAFAELDEYRAVGVYMLRSGEIVYFDARNGGELARHSAAVPGTTITAVARPLGGSAVAFAYSDGTFRTGTISFETSFVGSGEVTPAMRALKNSARLAVDGGIIEHTATGEMRRVVPSVSLDAPASVSDQAAPLLLIDYRPGDSDARLAAFTGTGALLLNTLSQSENMMTGETTTDVATLELPVPADLLARGRPAFILVTSKGDQLYVAWPDGMTARYDLRDEELPLLAEVVDIVTDARARLTTLRFMIGEQSLLAGDSAGALRSWFRVAREGANKDGHMLVPAHTLASGGPAISRTAVSSRDKTIIAGSADGRAVLYHMTSEQQLAEISAPGDSAVLAAQITPKSDGAFLLTTSGEASVWDVKNPHPETTLRSIFGKVWYEGYPEPQYTWQSSSGTDDFEPKFSLIPLIFGTLKATFYSLLFAIPIALLGAIYTSEFLERRYRAPLKSTIEMMASLPSVVLGFIAALVLAPLVENWVIAVLTVFAVIPLAALGAGYAWQMLPQRLASRFEGRLHFLLILVVVIISAWGAVQMAGRIEAWMFYGDFKAWLDGRVGTGTPGNALLAWPLLLVIFLVLDRRYLVDRISRRFDGRSRAAVAAVDAGKYAVLVVLSIATAGGLGWLLSTAGFDPRGELFGTYVQRNALIVGFVTGFAVIPIIYTITEDALSAVPQTLRSASLGCGATRWQTATRVVVPVALSGIFSAIMIGLGRAVGETMIVLMAAGNTPLMDFNVFNGLRTLSANIAVELPEAVKDGTLYRMLFLAALTLFVLTFIVNTLAEVVRQRVRRRAYQL